MSAPAIRFIETRKRHAPDGENLALQDYDFRMDGHDVVVGVQTGALQTLNQGQLQPSEVQLAARTLLEMALELDKTADGPMVLDEDRMVAVAARLNWQDRFRRG